MTQNHPKHPFHQWETSDNTPVEGAKPGDAAVDTLFQLYSQKAIALATYFGGPLAAGILIRRNFLNLGNERLGLRAIIAGVVGTILLFWGLFQIPESIMDKIPNPLIPAIYTGIIYLIVEKLQGSILDRHKEEKNLFYSNWKAAGIGLICGIIIIVPIFTHAFFADNWDAAAYKAGLEKYRDNESEALKLYDMLNNNSKHSVVSFIEQTGIPKWKNNIEILNEMSGIKNMPKELKKKTELLLEYSKLRLESYELISKAVLNETAKYNIEIYKNTARIQGILKELKDP